MVDDMAAKIGPPLLVALVCVKEAVLATREREREMLLPTSSHSNKLI